LFRLALRGHAGAALQSDHMNISITKLLQKNLSRLRRLLCKSGCPLLLTLMILTLAPVSCSSDEIRSFELPPTEVLSLRKNWAVVSQSYLPLYAEATIDSPITWNARRGEVFEVLEQSLETEYLYSRESHWFKVAHEEAEGWAFGAGLDSYASQEEARDAASRLSETQGEGF
jgi:hypothetical protein